MTTAIEVIRTKRDGNALTTAQIDWFINAYTSGEVADEQASALLMAIVWRGMNSAELNAWTMAMIESGTRLDLASIARPLADKHSTGGVGDKVSLVLAPIVAASGIAVPMLSGRGLGHTGGTLDKLEAIPGFNVHLSVEAIRNQLASVGAVICATTDDLAPADRKLYALRDVTATVESIPLIASSIMSKKIAEGTQYLVLDVKVGSGAFLPELTAARELAETMVGIGKDAGVRTTAVLTEMETPLGRTAGNALEVREAIETLRGDGPKDLEEVTLVLAAEMLALTRIDADPKSVLADGSALATWNQMVRAQGGDPDAALPEAERQEIVTSPQPGFVRRLDARLVGEAAWRLGAGRARKEDPVSAAAGVVCLAKPGDQVAADEPLIELHTDDNESADARLTDAKRLIESAIEFGTEPETKRPTVVEIIRGY